MLRRRFVAVSAAGLGAFGYSDSLLGSMSTSNKHLYQDQWPCWRGPSRNGYASNRVWSRFYR